MGYADDLAHATHAVALEPSSQNVFGLEHTFAIEYEAIADPSASGHEAGLHPAPEGRGLHDVTTPQRPTSSS